MLEQRRRCMAMSTGEGQADAAMFALADEAIAQFGLAIFDKEPMLVDTVNTVARVRQPDGQELTLYFLPYMAIAPETERLRGQFAIDAELARQGLFRERRSFDAACVLEIFLGKK